MSAEWLTKVLDDAHREVASWPAWKQQLARKWTEDAAKPYEQHRRYPVTRDGMII